MIKQFIRLSALRRQAQKDVAEHVARWDDKKRVLHAILGGAATNRQWLEEAQHKYAQALSRSGFSRAAMLTAALLDIYRCHYRMQHSRFEDESVHTLRQKYETTYLNAALNFIEDHIHDDVAVGKHYDLLNQAIGLLAEENSRLARAYQERIRQHQAVGDTRQRLQTLLKTPPEAATAALSLQIRALLHVHEATLKSDPATWDSLMAHLQSFIEQIYARQRERLDTEQGKPSPSLRVMAGILNDFAALYKPLRQYTYSRRYQAFLDERERWDEALAFLDKDFAELKKMYDWLSLPRDRVDERKIMALYERLAGFRHLAASPWKELSSLSPDIETIGARFEKVLEDRHRRDFIDIMRQYNALLNAPDGQARLRELGRFHSFLGARLDDNRGGAFTREQLTTLRQEVLQEIEAGWRKLLEQRLADAVDEQTLIAAFDCVIELALELESVERVTSLQRRKRILLEQVRAGEPVERAVRCQMDDEPSSPEPEGGHERLVILDNYSLRNYVLFTGPRITLGRDDDNDIILQSSFVSGKHAAIDFIRNRLTDLNTTNGTFADDKTRIEELPLGDVAWFDLAGSMVFSLRHFEGGIHFGLQKILDPELLDNPDKRSYNQSLLNTVFIWLTEGGRCRIHKVSGQVNASAGSDGEQIVITRRGDYFLFTDVSRNMHEQPLDEAQANLSDRFSFNLL
ncbi:MAG: FHA domain-containing protein [Candidatus Cloacimonetes bacterium]|nr:FHA domain-containing protein [Candidatus Cloacimonadota bacterium]